MFSAILGDTDSNPERVQSCPRQMYFTAGVDKIFFCIIMMSESVKYSFL